LIADIQDRQEMMQCGVEAVWSEVQYSVTAKAIDDGSSRSEDARQ